MCGLVPVAELGTRCSEGLQSNFYCRLVHMVSECMLINGVVCENLMFSNHFASLCVPIVVLGAGLYLLPRLVPVAQSLFSMYGKCMRTYKWCVI